MHAPLRWLPAFSLLAAFALSAWADDGILLERKTWKGQKLSVEEMEETAMDFTAEATGVGGLSGGKQRQTGKSVERKTRTYTQELVAALTDGSYRIERAYGKATKDTTKGTGGKVDSVATSLNGKKVVVFGKKTQVAVEAAPGMEIDDDAKGAAAFSEQIYGILPPKPVKAGDAWDVPGDVIGPIFFGGMYNPVGFKAAAKGKLREITTSGGAKCARILLQLELGVERTEKTPGIHYNVQGVMLFSLDDGTILSLDITGPVQFEVKQDGNTIKVDGSTVRKYRAKIVEKGGPAETPPAPPIPAGDGK